MSFSILGCSIIIPVIECTTRKIIHITFYCCLIYKIIVYFVTLHIQSLIIIWFLSKLEKEVGQMLAYSRKTSYWQLCECVYLLSQTWITISLILKLSIPYIVYINIHCLLYQLNAVLINTHLMFVLIKNVHLVDKTILIQKFMEWTTLK
jgi:hypothetical protein